MITIKAKCAKCSHILSFKENIAINTKCPVCDGTIYNFAIDVKIPNQAVVKNKIDQPNTTCIPTAPSTKISRAK